MNFIGHALLAAGGSDAFLLGNLVADGIKGTRLESLPKQVEQGVRWHRRVDAVIDKQPLVTDLVRRMPERRVAGIALDIVWDHFLSRDELSAALAERCYRVLASQPLPTTNAAMLEHLVRGRWLERYAELDFTLNAIAGVGRRLSGPNRLERLLPWIRDHYCLLEHTYQQLWPLLDAQLNVAYATESN
ncbi:ACP phosphodiesterase [Carnimonas bestiolae]|uniref:acyl carrier protein phosphodiesterase n=1 Tax=Carnimonas bestiolae TaxID=3402172 RepID=UPI003EDB831B